MSYDAFDLLTDVRDLLRDRGLAPAPVDVGNVREIVAACQGLLDALGIETDEVGVR